MGRLASGSPTGVSVRLTGSYNGSSKTRKSWIALLLEGFFWTERISIRARKVFQYLLSAHFLQEVWRKTLCIGIPDALRKLRDRWLVPIFSVSSCKGPSNVQDIFFLQLITPRASKTSGSIRSPHCREQV